MEQDARVEDEPWLQAVSDFCRAYNQTSMTALMNGLQIPVERRTTGVTTRLGRAMAALGWTMERRRDPATGERDRFYSAPEDWVVDRSGVTELEEYRLCGADSQNR